VDGLETLIGALQNELADVKWELLGQDTGVASFGIIRAGCVPDLIVVNVDISGLETDFRLLNNSANETRTKIEIITSNIGDNNSTIVGISDVITGLDDRVTVLEEISDYISDRSMINNLITNFRTQIDI
jgi:hypothetical protein